MIEAGLERGIESLPDKERIVVSLYFIGGMTLREIAGLFMVSESRICQIKEQALRRLKNSLKDDTLPD
jgi:RNA polymerase sigma factor for flagellar operon FliA